MTAGPIERGAGTAAVCRDRHTAAAMAGDGWNITDIMDAQSKAGGLLLSLSAHADAAAFQQDGDLSVIAAYPHTAPHGPGGRAGGTMPPPRIAERACPAVHTDAREPAASTRTARGRTAPRLTEETIGWLLEGLGHGKEGQP